MLDAFDNWAMNYDGNMREAKAPKMKGLSLYGSEVAGLRAKDGKLYSAKPVVMGGK